MTNLTNLTKIDWCSYRSKKPINELFCGIEGLFKEETEFPDLKKGWNGYSDSFGVSLRGKRLGFVATGGHAQKGWSQVQLTGDAIEHIADAPASLTRCVEAVRGQFKRVDIALTVRDGSVSSKTVLEAHRSGGFDCTANRPSCKTISPEDVTEGTTVYIGKRTQPKFLRAYDKGYQWANQFADAGISLTEINGVPVADIFRVELEIKAAPEDFPSDILINSDSFFAGAYPYLATICKADPSTFSLTPQRLAELDMNGMLSHIRRQYGNSLYTALAAHQGDYMSVWEKIVGRKHNQNLVERGALFANL